MAHLPGPLTTDRADLPDPLTTTDVYLAHVLGELVGLRADLAASRGGETAPPAEGGPIELIEPKPASKVRRTPARG